MQALIDCILESNRYKLLLTYTCYARIDVAYIPEHPNRICGVKVSMLALSVVDHRLMTKKLVFCCFSAKNAALRRKSKD